MYERNRCDGDMTKEDAALHKRRSPQNRRDCNDRPTTRLCFVQLLVLPSLVYVIPAIHGHGSSRGSASEVIHFF